MSIRTELMGAMSRILNDGPRRRSVGICANIWLESEQLGVVFNAVRRRLYSGWPSWSGCVTYPVPHPERMPNSGHSPFIVDEWAVAAYHRGKDHLWSGANLYLRRKLLWHCIKELRSMTDQEFDRMVPHYEH